MEGEYKSIGRNIKKVKDFVLFIQKMSQIFAQRISHKSFYFWKII